MFALVVAVPQVPLHTPPKTTFLFTNEYSNVVNAADLFKAVSLAFFHILLRHNRWPL